MLEKNETDMISRRKTFFLFGLGVLSLAISPTVLPVSQAEAQQPDTQTSPPATPTAPQSGEAEQPNTQTSPPATTTTPQPSAAQQPNTQTSSPATTTTPQSGVQRRRERREARRGRRQERREARRGRRQEDFSRPAGYFQEPAFRGLR